MWNQQNNGQGSGHFGYSQTNRGAANGGPSGRDYVGPLGGHNVYGANNTSGQVGSKQGNAYLYGGEYQGSAELGQRIGDDSDPYSSPSYAHGQENVSYDVYREHAQPAYGYNQPGPGTREYYDQTSFQAYRSDDGNARTESYPQYQQPSIPPVNIVSHEYASSARPTSYDHPDSSHPGPPSSAAFPQSAGKTSNGLAVEGASGRTESKVLENSSEKLRPVTLKQKTEANAGPEDHPVSTPVSKPALMMIKKNPSNGKPSGPRLAFGFKSASKVKATINPLKAALETDELEREEAERKEEAERAAKRQKLGIAPPPSEAPARAPAAPPPG